MRQTFVVLVLLVLSVTASAGQSFDVTSVKPIQSLSPNGSMRMTGGRLTAPNVNMRALIGIAYDLQGVRLVGGPEWLATDYFSVTATAVGNPTQAAMRVMLQNLLKDRIQLAVHRETRPLAGYALEVLRNDRLGPGLRRRPTSCRNPLAVPLTPNPALSPCGFSVNGGKFTGGGILMSTLAQILESAAGGIIEDRTGLEGEYDIELEWAAELTPSPGVDSLPSIFAAVQDQLGLRLRQQQVPTEVLVIDSAERPKPD